MENSNYSPFFVHAQGTIATNPSIQQNLVDVPIHSHHCLVNHEPDVLVNTTNDKLRLRWTRELHARFLEVVHDLGGAFKATPKTIHAAMNIDGLTRLQVKSHLQKFRQGLQSPKTQDAQNGDFDIGLSDGSGPSNFTMASSSCMEAQPLDVPLFYQVPFQAEYEQVMQLVPENWMIEEPAAACEPQVHDYEEDILPLPPMTLSPRDKYLGDSDQSSELEMANVVPSSDPFQHQHLSYEEVVQALPPITPSPKENYLKAFGQSGDWAMEHLLMMEIDNPWGF